MYPDFYCSDTEERDTGTPALLADHPGQCTEVATSGQQLNPATERSCSVNAAPSAGTANDNLHRASEARQTALCFLIHILLR